MAAPSGSSASVPSLPPPRPKSPPQYPDLYGKRRETARVQMLEREIGFLEEELKSVERLQPASRCCKEVVDFVVANPDPLIPTNRKKRRSCRFWKWLCGMPCFSCSWIFCCCCDGCSLRLEMPRCCDCSPCNCNPCACCPLPKWRCCCSCPRSNCCKNISCGRNCCIFPPCSCPDCSCANCCIFPSCSCPDCSCTNCCKWKCSCPKCPKVRPCCCCRITCCNPCSICF
ncbi:guanine nucleotide-binding protein subunit gamma 3-like [Pyrus ussuriensis x Pyrus communis]|uniref:Guanine nucleotide-binding protein subunit gamma 3-like n=1 Tax=Pyrus ussuriensis x Pyrus communis TaxID=2448454 RepID=A0A5N5I1B7_9ROSA|nr:guanine nucleotide-binding protein subunit gamma 3-like [Pyrus ussuriensis x Pyrus communis]